MELKNYQHADCTLFRQPPLDFSQVEEFIEEKLIKMWESGYSASNTLDTLLENETVAKKLKGQIAENLNFQRQVSISGLEQERKEKIESYKEQKKEEIISTKAAMTAVIEEKKGAHATVSADYEKKSESFYVANSRLNEMRNRLQEKLEKIGGEKSLQTVLEINKVLEQPPQVPQEKQSTGVTQSSDPKKEGTQQKESQKKKRSLLKRIWRVLRYEIW